MDKNQETKKGWLAANLEDWEFRRLYERELVAESFLVRIEDEMNRQGVTKSELAKRMQCSVANISRAMRKSTNMTISTMVDMALSLNLRMSIAVEPSAVDACTIAPQKSLATTWSPAFNVEEHTMNPAEAFVVYLQKGSADADSCGASLPRLLWMSQSIHDNEAPLAA